MKRWRKNSDDEDDVLTFEGLEDADEEEERPKRRPYLPPRPFRTHFSSIDDDDEAYGADDQAIFDELEPKIRAGKYKPKRKDPWNAHVLYNLLKSMGEI